MSLTKTEVDHLIDTHFSFEATDNLEGVLASLAPGVEHHVIPSPDGVLRDKERIREFYRAMFADLKGRGVTPVRRLYGEGFVLDESIWHGRIDNGRLFGCPGKSGDVSFRLLHVFEFSGSLIARENVWCDLAAIQSQLGATVH